MDNMDPDAKILIVDDDPVNRKILVSLLEKQGFRTITAENGKQAVMIFQFESPDLVLMDIIMPEMNGYDAAKIIKENSQDKFIPIIFLTAMTNEDALLKCVENGGDDFLTKPFNGVILKAKINALQRIKSLYNTLHKNRQELEHYRASIEHELEFAEHILANITAKASIELPYIKFWSSSLSPSDFSGDLFFVARKPTGGLHLMVCDFSGHGLPAAVGALPVSEIFVAMTSRGFSMYDILMEMNKKLTKDLPTGFFCAAVFVDIDHTRGSVSIVNAGLPGCVVMDTETGSFHDIPSSQLPLGICLDGLNKEGVDVFEIKKGFKLLLYTDGLSEFLNASGEQFGGQRVAKCIEETRPGDDLIEVIKKNVKKFCGEVLPRDDITAMELDCFAAIQDVFFEKASTQLSQSMPAEWKIEFDLSIAVLKAINPVPLILNVISNLKLPADHRKRIFTIISELYSNALDHGLLKLDSALKSTPDGFMRYYQEKEKRLVMLKDGWAKIRIEHVVENGDYTLNIQVTDSGEGFDFEAVTNTPVIAESRLASGRGIQLVKSMTHTFEYQKGGCVADVKYLIREVAQELENE